MAFDPESAKEGLKWAFEHPVISLGYAVGFLMIVGGLAIMAINKDTKKW